MYIPCNVDIGDSIAECSEDDIGLMFSLSHVVLWIEGIHTSIKSASVKSCKQKYDYQIGKLINNNIWKI